jgi:hypothetical protein
MFKTVKTCLVACPINHFKSEVGEELSSSHGLRILLDFGRAQDANPMLYACQKLAICQFIPTNSTQHNLRVLPREKRQKDAAMTLFASFKSGNGHKEGHCVDFTHQ